MAQTSNDKQPNITQGQERSAARLLAVQALYQSLLNGQGAKSVVSEFLAERTVQVVDGDAMCAPDKQLFSKIISGVEQRRADLDSIIAAHLKKPGGKESKIPEKLLQSILLCGIYEIMAHSDVDAPIIINDYVDVAHAFYDGGESKLVNAVLDRATKNLRDAS